MLHGPGNGPLAVLGRSLAGPVARPLQCAPEPGSPAEGATRERRSCWQALGRAEVPAARPRPPWPVGARPEARLRSWLLEVKTRRARTYVCKRLFYKTMTSQATPLPTTPMRVSAVIRPADGVRPSRVPSRGPVRALSGAGLNGVVAALFRAWQAGVRSDGQSAPLFDPHALCSRCRRTEESPGVAILMPTCTRGLRWG